MAHAHGLLAFHLMASNGVLHAAMPFMPLGIHQIRWDFDSLLRLTAEVSWLHHVRNVRPSCRSRWPTHLPNPAGTPRCDESQGRWLLGLWLSLGYWWWISMDIYGYLLGFSTKMCKWGGALLVTSLPIILCGTGIRKAPEAMNSVCFNSPCSLMKQLYIYIWGW